MAWDDTQGPTDSITYTEWNNMVTYIKARAAASDLTNHTNDSTIHFTEASIDHTNIANVGSNTHAEIDTHIADTTNPHSVTASQVGNAVAQWNAGSLYGVGLDSTVGSPADGKVLVYRDAGSDWILEDKPAGGDPALNDVSDVEITSVGDNDILAYDTTSGSWINQTGSEAGLATTQDLGSYLQNISEDTTPQLGGNLDMNEKYIIFSDSLSADDTATGFVGSFTAGANVAFGDLCYLNSAGKMAKTDADAEATSKGLLGVALGTINTDNQGYFLLRGFLRDDSYDWSIGSDLYISTTEGQITETAPNGVGDIVRIVGQGYTADILYFNPDNTYIEI